MNDFCLVTGELLEKVTVSFTVYVLLGGAVQASSGFANYFAVALVFELVADV